MGVIVSIVGTFLGQRVRMGGSVRSLASKKYTAAALTLMWEALGAKRNVSKRLTLQSTQKQKACVVSNVGANW